MSKILYGLSGQGSGHASRAKVILPYLLKKGHEVRIVSHDSGYKNLKDLYDVTEIDGMHLSYNENKVSQFKTLYQNVLKTPKVNRSTNKVNKIIKDFQPDLCIVDFEPITSYAAYLKKIPIISMDNQHQITRTKIEYPGKYRKDALQAKAVIRLFVLHARYYLITSFFKTPITKRNTDLFPPILRNEIFNLRPKKGDHILVYLTYKFDKMIDILKSINKEFIVYGFNVDKKDKNITFKKASNMGFLRDLEKSEGVLANAGLTLMCEALYLGKPYLALPVKNQFEQILNGYYLEKLGYGKYWDELNIERIESFLYNIPKYEEKLKYYKRENNQRIFRKLDELIKRI